MRFCESTTMPAKTPPYPRPGYPPSPCVDICALDDDNNCLGCRRSVDEIVRWGTMSAAEQWQLVKALPARSGD